MNHLIDYASHAALRSVIYRLVWHAPPEALMAIGVVACLFVMMTRR